MLTNLFWWLFQVCFCWWGQLFRYIISLLSWLRVKAEEKSSDINHSSSMPRGCHQPAHCNLIKMGKEGIVCVCVCVCWEVCVYEWMWRLGMDPALFECSRVWGESQIEKDFFLCIFRLWLQQWDIWSIEYKLPRSVWLFPIFSTFNVR